MADVGLIRKLTAGLAGLDPPRPPEKAPQDQRRRLGPGAAESSVRGSSRAARRPHTPGLRFAGLRTAAFDGLNSLKVPGTSRNQI